ncbi:FkbM family methyltransferase [Kordiimonas sp. SCSIO 12603]|uniref:FkbM family methyltransferase n=1 Tax=Kordiimonas sp. SCSIO 12603 TaxID=2829596 RepID=UPI0021038941|nr:FkbM family methyltransferase [Kordiimonas sp. SCSIO 12603]UTW59746.1 FkbM family methyltransferase [Kordiimonas sp. SCSIO 12603]
MDKLIKSAKTMGRGDILSAARKLISTYPSDDKLYFTIATLLISAKHYPDAMTYLQLCTYHNEDHTDAWALQGLLASLARDYGKAIQASKKAISKGQHLHHSLTKAFIFSLFLTGNPGEIGNMKTAPFFETKDIPKTLLAEEPSIEFYRLPSDKSATAKKPTLLCSSDSNYFNKYTKNLLLSLKGTEDIHTIHVHIIDATDQDLKWLDQNFSGNLIVSTETLTETRKNIRSYLASIRFIRAAYFINRFKTDYLIIDADSLLNSKERLEGFYRSEKKVALYYVSESPIWDKVSAPFVFIPCSDSGQTFINHCANFLDTVFHSGDPDKGFWYIDQLALMGSYIHIHSDAKLIDAALLSDIECGTNAIFWTLSNHNPKAEYAQRCEELNAAQPIVKTVNNELKELAIPEHFSDEIILQKFMAAIAKSPQASKALQIGANDGISYDPIYHPLQSRPDIHITLIEPITEYFCKLVENYSYRENVNFLNLAVSNHNGEAELRYLPLRAIEKADLPSWARGMATLERNKNGLDKTFESSTGIQETDDQTLTDIYKAIHTQKAKLVEINQLLGHVFYEGLHILVTDCEGHDYALLKALDLDKHAPNIILSEWNLMNKEKQEEIIAKFSPRYSLYLGHEYFFAVKKGIAA